MDSPERFLLCPPRFYGVEYVINLWMEGNVGRARRDIARRQWEVFRSALAARAAVEIIEPVAGLPDMPFTANAGLVREDVFIPARFRFQQRQPEVKQFIEWFRQRGYRIVELPGQGTFEGEGDALFQPGEALLWSGYGVRSSLQVCRSLMEILDVDVVPLCLIDERFYHLDTCFCPLPDGRIVYYPEAFDRESLAIIEQRVPAERRFCVPRTDALRFACNAIVTGTSFITNFAGEALRAQLAKWGYEVLACPLDEFILSGGAAKCLALNLTHPFISARPVHRPEDIVYERVVEVRGHLLDSALMNEVLDSITAEGGSFEIETFQAGLRHDQDSWARLRAAAPSASRMRRILQRLEPLGARPADEDRDARLEAVTLNGVAPADFYSTTIFPTDVRIAGRWMRAEGQRMDAVLVVEGPSGAPRVACRLPRALHVGQLVACGTDGVRICSTAPRTHAPHEPREAFGFMGSVVSSERRVELAVERVAEEMRRIHRRGGKIVVVAGPVVIHTGGSPHLASLIRRGYVQALLGGNGLAAHDIEESLFGTSLGVDLKRGTPVAGGHQHHLRAINTIRACGSIANAVRARALRGGVMYECVTNQVPFALAGSIRDDGPLPDTLNDMVAAQDAYAQLVRGTDLILMLASMLHAIGVGNMTPAGVRLICVDINPAVVTKLADRGSIAATGIVTDIGLFLNLLDSNLCEPEPAASPVIEPQRTWTQAAHE